MPKQTPSASEFTSVVRDSAVASAAVGNAASGIKPKGASSVPIVSLGAIAAIVTRSAVAASSGLQPVAARPVVAPAVVAVPTVQSVTLANDGPANTNDVFVSLYTPSGGLIWAARITGGIAGGGNDDKGVSISAKSGADKIYVMGNYKSNPITLYNKDGTQYGTLNSLGGATNIFIAKYDSTGMIKTAFRVGGTNTTGASVDLSGYSMTTDSDENIYITGRFNGDMALYNKDGSFYRTLSLSGYYDTFIIKYSSTGTILWATSLPGSGTWANTQDENGNSIAVDSTGNVYVVGMMRESETLALNNGDGTSSGIQITSTLGIKDGFIVKYNSSGTAQWGMCIAGTNNDQAYVVTTDSTGNVYVSGAFRSNLSIFNNGNSTAVKTFTGSENDDAYLIKYNSGGIFQWGVSYNTFGIGGIATDATGNVYITGFYYFSPTVFNSQDNSTSISVTGSNNSLDIYVAKYNSSGIIQWVAKMYTPTVHEIGNSIATDSTGNVYVTGYYGDGTFTIYNKDETQFGTIVNTSGIEGFVAKYNTSGIAQWISRISGASGNDIGNSISTDSTGNVCVTGQFNSSSLKIYSQGL